MANEVAPDLRDYCICGKEIPPGPEFCSMACERKAVDAWMQELASSLGGMLGLVKYGIDCDSWYFSEEQVPGITQQLEEAEKLYKRWS